MPEGRRPATDADLDDAVRAILALFPRPEALWIFAYGSLIWNPAFDFVERHVGLARGWRRAFCLGWDKWVRGCAERPGLMLALDRGGQCRGVLYRLPPDSVETNLKRLVRREIQIVPHPFPPRRIKVSTDNGPIEAATFAIDRKSTAYLGGLSLEQIADALSVASGRNGSMAEYLLATVTHLEELGLHDANLWRLQDMVAQRIEASHAARKR